MKTVSVHAFPKVDIRVRSTIPCRHQQLPYSHRGTTALLQTDRQNKPRSSVVQSSKSENPSVLLHSIRDYDNLR
jgi:hypothetical protein